MQARTTLASRLLGALRSGIDAVAAKARLTPTLWPLLNLAWPRLFRLLGGIDRLTAKWEAGRLPTPRPRAKRPESGQKPARPAQALPTRFGWFNQAGAGMAAAGLSTLLHEPESEVRALIEAAPKAGRLFRPLCHILGVTPPDWLRLPKRPRKPRPRKPPRPESRSALLRRFRTMTDAELTAWFHPLPPPHNLPIPGYQKIRRRIRAYLAAGGARP